MPDEMDLQQNTSPQSHEREEAGESEWMNGAWLKQSDGSGLWLLQVCLGGPVFDRGEVCFAWGGEVWWGFCCVCRGVEWYVDATG